MGVFPEPPRQTLCVPLFEEHFVGIARQEHPAITDGLIALETFATLPHALVTIRRDATGAIDKALAHCNLKRRIALTIPHVLVLPFVLSSSELIASVPSRLASKFASQGNLQVFELPIETATWTVSLLWSKLADRNTAREWLRKTTKNVCEQV